MHLPLSGLSMSFSKKLFKCINWILCINRCTHFINLHKGSRCGSIGIWIYPYALNFFSQSSYSFGTPVGVILLRVMAFLTCAFLVATALYGSGDQTASAGAPQTLSGGIIPPKPAPSNKSTPKNGSSEAGQVFQDLLELLPEEAVENAKLVWQYGRNHQMAVVSIGLLTCITGVCLGGPVR